MRSASPAFKLLAAVLAVGAGTLLLLSPSSSAGPVKKAPVPDKAAQDKSFSLVLDIFKEDFESAKSPEAKTKLATHLLQQGRESRDNLGDRYVLYREALSLAETAGDFNLAFTVIDEMNRDRKSTRLNSSHSQIS